ncbi:MAG: glycosyltransferase family 9 protein [Verrucomicrobiota bacterium]
MSFRTILVVKPSSLGDVVHTLPSVALLKRAWPKATLRWLVNPEWAPLLEGNPDIDELIVFPRRELGGIAKLPKQIRWIRHTGATYQSELVVDFQGLLRSAIIGRACRAPGGRLIGLSDAREGARYFYDQVVQTAANPEHAVDRYLRLPAELGLKPAGPLDWRLPQGTRPAGFTLDQPFVLLHPFSRGAGKSLSAEETELFCKAAPFPVVLAGKTDVEVTPSRTVVNLLNRTTIPELIWLIRNARFVVSVDSGPMHIAAALTPNLLSIHTWSDPALVGPHHPDAWVWKGRTLLQVRQLRETPQPGVKPLTAPDIRAVAEFVAGL